ncbi:MAG: hypothetical protein ChlgKO_14460 [Chlamydiales bacterium]
MVSDLNLPGYVVNIPMVVPSGEDEGYSSDEELDGNFHQECFDNPQEYIRLHPYSKRSNPLRGRVLEIKTSEPSNLPETDKIQLAWDKFQTENVRMKGTLLPRVRVVVGLNRMRSLSTIRNKSLEKELNSGSGETPIQKIGFLWDGRWEKWNGDRWEEVSYEFARKFYKQLKKNDPDKAKNYREETEKNKREQIPYREIRDAIKNHSATRESINKLRAQNIDNIFLLFLDGDLESFRSSQSKGPFVTIDSLSKNPKLHIISTGYVVDEPENRAFEIGVQADLAVRDATTNHIKNGAYYPEPCTAVKIREDFDTVSEDFTDGTSKYESPKEMPRLIEKVVRARGLNPQTSMEFDPSGAIITTTPDRMKRDFKSQKNKKGKLISWGLSDFETMRDINQSHYNSRDWATNLIAALKLKKEITLFGITLHGKGAIQDCAISLLSRMFNAFDPVEQAKGPSFQQNLIAILKSPHEFTVDLPQPHTKGREFRGKNKEDKEKLWKGLDAIDSFPKLKDALCKILQDPLDHHHILSAAVEINKKLVELFKNTLSLDFEENIQNILHELTGINELPKVFQNIISREPFLKKDLCCKGSLSPLHIAAIAGNREAIPTLLKWKQDLSQVDSENRYPFEYGLIYCKNNGFDLPLLDALWCDDVSDVANELICESALTTYEQLQLLEFLSQKYGNDVIRIYGRSLFFEAIYCGKVALANQLAEYSDTVSEDLADELLTVTPNWDSKLQPWLEYIDEEDLYFFLNGLSETERTLFEIFNGTFSASEFSDRVLDSEDDYDEKIDLLEEFGAGSVDPGDWEPTFFKAIYNDDRERAEALACEVDMNIPLAIQHELVANETWKPQLEELAREHAEDLDFDKLKLDLGSEGYKLFLEMINEESDSDVEMSDS